MAKKFKLKENARQFFNSEYKLLVKELQWWNNKTIPIELLDEVDKVYIEYGRKPNENTVYLKGYSWNDKLAHIDFTLFVTDMENEDYEAIDIPAIMDEMQKTLNKFFKQPTP